MLFGFSWLIPRERRECSLAKPMRLTFLWEAKAGGRENGHVKNAVHCEARCTALRWLMQRAAMADAPQCVICPKIPPCGKECGRHIIAEPFQASPCRLQTK